MGDACYWDNRGATAASKEIFCSNPSGGEGSKQRPPMWLKLNVYHVQVQWVTYFQECSFIRPKIYYPQPSTSPHFFFSVSLGRCEAGAGLSFCLFLFLFGVGVDSFSLKRHVFLILGPFVWKLFIDPWISFHSRLSALPLLWFGFRSGSRHVWVLLFLTIIFGLRFLHLLALLSAIYLLCWYFISMALQGQLTVY